MPEFVYLLTDHPALIVAPIILFAALAVWSRSRIAWVATGAWVLYLFYELGMYAAVFCTGDECVKRTPLYVVYPLLAFLSLVALVKGYVNVRDKRIRERALAVRR